ncbi:MAG: imelysin family protein [Rhodocyclaceae bacterium]|nr:imelysin family protein [Rhodocyclaceae bacterium]
MSVLLRSLFGLALVLLALPGRAEAPAPMLEPSAMASALAEKVLVPGYAALQRDVDALAKATDGFCGGSGTSLDEVRSAWRHAALSLRRISALSFGPALESRILRRIDYWPTRPSLVEQGIERLAADPGDTARIGLPARGLPAIEYLLFVSDPPLAPAAKSRCAYLTWLGRDVAEQLSPLPEALRHWAESMRDSEFDGERALLDESLNVLIGSTEAFREKYVEKLRTRGIDASDGGRSGSTLPHLNAYFEGLATALQGTEGVPGLIGFLRGRGHLSLADALGDQITQVRSALGSLPDPLDSRQGRESLDALGKTLAGLQRMLTEDAADALQVAVGFGEGDGD